MMSTVSTLDRTSQRLLLRGRVQGIGLRPAVARWAAACGVVGFVRNTEAGVEIVVEGGGDAVAAFQTGLHSSLPVSEAVIELEAQGRAPSGFDSFEIITGGQLERLSTPVPLDSAICGSCQSEIEDAHNRRYRYPFTNCTACGPRYSIIESMPYERAHTAMRHFAMCAECQREYCSPSDRRFHSQTNCCPKCGPQVWLSDRSGRALAKRDAALHAVVEALRTGKIVALRGLGGYQLLANAADQATVEQLRQCKGRRSKPLAVMVSDVVEARRIASLTEVERNALASAANPIVVLSARQDCSIASSVAGGLNTIGILLPTTALHSLIVRDFGGPLVCTSGNAEGEPLAVEVDESLIALGEIADVWLHHNRPIVASVDDSVVRVIADQPATIRLGRGLAPLILSSGTQQQAVAYGGQQKATIALATRGQCILSPHIGDLDDVKTRERYHNDVQRLSSLYLSTPQYSVCDQHPDYFTTRLAAQSGPVSSKVQHHHAHIVSAMLERGWMKRTVVGVALDGTGYGTDGTIWGGEFLVVDAARFTRAGHLLPFSLPGGDAAIRQPWRVAVSLMAIAKGEQPARQVAFRQEPQADVERVVQLCAHKRWAPLTSSAGRLFDAAAALALDQSHSDFEGQAAMRLEACCDHDDAECYPFDVAPAESALVVDWRPMIAQLLNDRQQGVAPGRMAMRFHRGFAEAIVAVCQHIAALPVVLAGGVFQNRVLTELVHDRLVTLGREVATPGVVPANDGGLAAGQLAVALARSTL